jgi:hypothetical protein
LTYFLSIAALLAGPFLYATGRRRPALKQLLDGFVMVAVAGIVCVSIIPDALQTGGVAALPALVLGLAFPVLIERWFHNAAHTAHLFVVLLAAAGLVVHALIDGIALLPQTAEAGAAATHAGPAAAVSPAGITPLALGVILHRLPIGMALWWSVRPNFGVPVTLALFAIIIAATGVAYYQGDHVVALASTSSLALFQAFVAGSLVHVVAFGVTHDEDEAQFAPAARDWGFRAGILLGIFLLFSVPRIYLH